MPVLAPLLEDPRLASWARVALEAIPGPAADAALRTAVPKLQGRLLVGTINSIGVRRDAKAVGELTGKLKDADADVASAAAVALGRIGGADAAAALKSFLAAAPPAVRGSAAEGCIRCAEQFLADRESGQAIELYDLVRIAICPSRIFWKAFAARFSPERMREFLCYSSSCSRSDKALFQIGLRAARELPGPKATEAVVAEMRSAIRSVNRCSCWLWPIAMTKERCRPFSPRRELGPKTMRLVAVKILDRMGKASTVPVLLVVAAVMTPS